MPNTMDVPGTKIATTRYERVRPILRPTVVSRAEKMGRGRGQGARKQRGTEESAAVIITALCTA